MKTCFKCGLGKPLDMFYRQPGNNDGRAGKCMECAKADVRMNYSLKRDQYHSYERSRFKDPNRRAKLIQYQRERRRRCPEKTIARSRLLYAVRTGKIARLPCEKCGAVKSQAHHEDYSKPLDVRWLCFPCHRREHGQVPTHGVPAET